MKRITCYSILYVCLYGGVCSLLQFCSGCSCVPPPPATSQQTEAKNETPKEQPSDLEQENTTDGKTDYGSSSSAESRSSKSSSETSAPSGSSTEPQTKGGNPGFGLGTRPNSSGKSQQPSSSTQARDEAKSLQAKAERQHAAGKSGEAFLSATKAWELVQAHPADIECQQLATELFPLMQQLGEAAEKSSPRREPFTTRPLRVK